jgi:hypothetical protein
MTPCQFLTFVCCGCIYTSYESCHRRTTGATSQSRAYAASAWLVAFPSCPATREGMFPLFPSGVSVYRAGPRANNACSRRSSQGRIHYQIAFLAGAQAPSPCGSQAAYVERHRQSRLDSGARSRTGAWLTTGQPGHRARFSGNISLIAYSIPSSSKPMRLWSLISDGLRANPRR